MAEVERPRPGRRRWLLWVPVCVATASLFGCCVLAPLVLRPAVDVNTFRPEECQTMSEVRARYGPPSGTHAGPAGTTTWTYYTDKYGLGWHYVGVNFDEAGRVTSSFNH